MKFVLIVEGYTEKESLGPFLKRWLDPRLAQPVRMKMDRQEGNSEFLIDLPRRVSRHLGAPDAGDTIAVIGLLDLYGIRDFYPDHLHSAVERLEWARNHLQKKVGQEKFRMFFAVHEVEAWLLSDPALFPDKVRKAFPGKIRQPEQVNFDEPPAKLIDRLYREKLSSERRIRTYKKRPEGRVNFGQLDPNLVYNACPYFSQMMDELLALAKDAGL